MNLLNENFLILKIILIALLPIILVQLFLLVRIRKVLKNMAYYIEILSRFFYRFGNSESHPSPNTSADRTCQFCKFRMSFIHMGEKESHSEDFYYKCRLRNVDINLKDSCDLFEAEKMF